MSNYLREFIAAVVATPATVSLEAESTQGIERELVYYGKVVDFNEVREKAARWEEQEQWELKSPVGTGRIRVRCSHGKGEDEALFTNFVMTTKIRKEDGTDIETEQDVSEDIFLAFKRLAPNGMRKTRYYYPFESNGVKLIWEVDVFNDPENDGTPHEWVKIDLELPTDYQTTREKWVYPVEFSEVIQGGGRFQSDAEKERVQKLYDDVILLKNVGKSRGPSKEVSNEGFLDFFKSKKVDVKELSQKEILARFQTTYLNDSWLSAKEWRSGDIKASGFIDILEGKAENSNTFVKDFIGNVRTVSQYASDVISTEVKFEQELLKSVKAIMANEKDIPKATKVFLEQDKRLLALSATENLGPKYLSKSFLGGYKPLEKAPARSDTAIKYYFSSNYSHHVELIHSDDKHSANVRRSATTTPLKMEDVAQLKGPLQSIIGEINKIETLIAQNKLPTAHVYFEDIDEVDVLFGKIAEELNYDAFFSFYEGGYHGYHVIGGSLELLGYYYWLLVKLERYVKASIK